MHFHHVNAATVLRDQFDLDSGDPFAEGEDHTLVFPYGEDKRRTRSGSGSPLLFNVYGVSSLERVTRACANNYGAVGLMIVYVAENDLAEQLLNPAHRDLARLRAAVPAVRDFGAFHAEGLTLGSLLTDLQSPNEYVAL